VEYTDLSPLIHPDRLMKSVGLFNKSQLKKKITAEDFVSGGDKCS
jgi:hypothetical protein